MLEFAPKVSTISAPDENVDEIRGRSSVAVCASRSGRVAPLPATFIHCGARLPHRTFGASAPGAENAQASRARPRCTSCTAAGETIADTRPLRDLQRCAYFPASSCFTISLTVLPSARTPLAANFAMVFFITVPMSFAVGAPISPITARTAVRTSSSDTAFGM